MKEVYEHSEAAGVRCAIEPLNRFETYFINRAEQAMGPRKRQDPIWRVPRCLPHQYRGRGLYEAICSTKGRLTDFHVAENNSVAGGHGTTTGRRSSKPLRQHRVRRCLTAEFVATIDRTPGETRYPNALETDFTDISPEQLQFIIDHGSSPLTEEFYDWLVMKNSEALLPLIGN